MIVGVPNVGQVNVDKLPDSCPVCLMGVQPIDTGQAHLNANSVERVFRCPRQQCERFFVARHLGNRLPNGTMNYILTDLVPLTIKGSNQSDVIKRVSPDFVAIFEQAEGAEQRGLKLVCGPGYRKALEFLIKDYVIKTDPDQAEQIKKQTLAKCIADHVSSDRIKQIAARAVWLGNDETHYLRKWDGKDLVDLKGLVALTVHWIEMEELTKAVLADMPEGK